MINPLAEFGVLEASYEPHPIPGLEHKEKSRILPSYGNKAGTEFLSFMLRVVGRLDGWLSTNLANSKMMHIEFVIMERFLRFKRSSERNFFLMRYSVQSLSKSIFKSN
jgi:hypothetical protein